MSVLRRSNCAFLAAQKFMTQQKLAALSPAHPLFIGRESPLRASIAVLPVAFQMAQAELPGGACLVFKLII